MICLRFEAESFDEIKKQIEPLFLFLSLPSGKGIAANPDVQAGCMRPSGPSPAPVATKAIAGRESEIAPKRGRGRPPKVKPVVVEEAKPVVADPPADTSYEIKASIPADSTSGYLSAELVITLDQVKIALINVAKKYGVDVEQPGYLLAKEILRRFDCEIISELNEKQYPEFLKMCQDVLAKGII